MYQLAYNYFSSEKAMPRETLSHRLRQATLLRLDRLVGGCVTLWTFADLVLSTGCTLLAYSILEQDDRPRTDVVCFDLNCPSGIRSWRQSGSSWYLFSSLPSLRDPIFVAGLSPIQ